MSGVSRSVVRLNHKALLVCLSRTSTTAAGVGTDSPMSSDVKPFNKIPGPKGLYSIPYLGAALLFKPFSNYEPSEIDKVLMNLKNKYGDIFKVRLGKDYIVYINHPDYAKTVMLAHYEEHKRPLFDLSVKLHERTGITKGMIVLNGNEWAERRKPAQEKMLRPAVVGSYIPLIGRVTDDFVEKLRKTHKVDDLLEELYCYTTESVGMLCFNRRLGCLESGVTGDDSAAACMKRALEILQNAFFMPVKTYMYFRTKMYNEFEKVLLRLREIVITEITAQRKFLSNLEKENKLEEYLEKEPNFMYSMLSDKRITDDQITSIITDLFGAGIDSTANTLVFLLVELAINKDKQDNLYEEIKSVVGASPTLTKEHIARMTYLKACLKESLRKTFPSSFGVLRIPEEDLVVGGYQIPKDHMIAVNMRTMTSDERFFPRPREFLPERWLRDTTGDLTKGQQYPFATKPFSFGPRGCIGQRFAENEIFVCVSKIIQNFEISVPPGVTEVKSTLKIFTSPAEKVQLYLKER